MQRHHSNPVCDFTWLPFQPGYVKVNKITGDSIFLPLFHISHCAFMTQRIPPNKFHFKHCMPACYVMSDFVQPYGLWPTGLPCTWDSPGKNIRVPAFSFSGVSSRPRDWTHVSYISCISRSVLYHQRHLWSPILTVTFLKKKKKKI